MKLSFPTKTRYKLDENTDGENNNEEDKKTKNELKNNNTIYKQKYLENKNRTKKNYKIKEHEKNTSFMFIKTEDNEGELIYINSIFFLK